MSVRVVALAGLLGAWSHSATESRAALGLLVPAVTLVGEAAVVAVGLSRSVIDAELVVTLAVLLVAAVVLVALAVRRLSASRTLRWALVVVPAAVLLGAAFVALALRVGYLTV